MLSNSKRCIVCGATTNLHRHHIFYGTSNRKQSELYDLCCWLCWEHHEGATGVHSAKGVYLNNALKKMAQKEFEKEHTRDEFIKTFGRNYLDD